MIRIHGGLHRGRILKGPRGKHFRPTQGRIRETLFSILGEKIHDADLLELFAGSGAVGLEALSRGAGSVLFIESAVPHIRIIQQNIDILSCRQDCQVRRGDVFRIVKSLQRSFDLIFADPPYADGLHQRIIHAVHENNLLRSTGMLIIEHDCTDTVETELPFRLMKAKTFGQTRMSFYEFVK